MKQKYIMIFWIFGGLFLTACRTDGRYQVTLITEGDHNLSGTVGGDLVILGGKATLEPGAILTGSVHVISGNFQWEGEIREDLSLLGGTVISGPQARVGGDLNFGGGELNHLNRSNVGGKINTGTGIQIPSLESQPNQSPAGELVRWVINAFTLGLLALLTEYYLPKPVSRLQEAAMRHALVSLAMGMMVGIVGISLVVLLAYTILLIPVALLGLVLLGVGVIYGWLSFGIALGRFTTQYWMGRISPRWAVFGGTFVFMLSLSLISAIPIVGGILGILVASLALGAVFLTRFGIRNFVPETP